MPLEFIPADDQTEFLSLSRATRAKAEQLHHIAERVVAATGRKMEVYQQLAEEMKVHVNTIYKPVSQFISTRNWRVLIDRRLEPKLWHTKTTRELPHAFVEFWKQLVEDNQRCAKTAYEFLIMRLHSWRRGNLELAIPGYVVAPPNAPGKTHPRKWSYRDLLRCGPSDIELAAARNGRSAARKLTPAVFTTRKGGYPLMELQFDDMWHDFEVIYQKKLCRILEFNAVDYYSTYVFNPGLRPRVNMDGTNKSLTEREFRIYAIHLLATVGWSPRGTTLQAERGTAAFRDGLAQKLVRWSNGSLRIPLPGMSGQSAFVGGWSERAKGNPNAKALKEGMGKIIHNRLASLPGQVGMNPTDKPSSSFGRDAETLSLLQLQGLITGGEGLQLSHLTFEQGVQRIYQVYAMINDRVDHRNESWEEEGLITTEFLTDPANDAWLNLSMMPEAQRSAIAQVSAHCPHLFRIRNQSPAEVLQPALAHTIKLSPQAEADCLYDDCKRDVVVSKGHLSFQDAEMGLGTFRYKARYQGVDGFPRQIPNDESVTIVVNPFNPDRGFIFDLRGAYLGLVQRDHDVMRSDVDALHRKIGAAEADFKAAKLAAEFRHGLKRENQLNHNARTLIDSLQPQAPVIKTTTDISDLYSETIEPTHKPLDIDMSILLQ